MACPTCGETSQSEHEPLCSECAWEAQSQGWYDLGRSAGLEEAAFYLANTAKEYFANKKDSLARLLRKESDYLQGRADAARPGKEAAEAAGGERDE